MTKKTQRENRDLVKVAPDSVPSFLAKEMEVDTSLDAMKEYRVVPRIKIVQSTADQALLMEFDAGDMILQPGNVLVSKVDKKQQKSSPFLFVPTFFFPEYCKWSDLKDTESFTIMERSLDPTSELASKAKSSKNREEPYGDGFVARYVEHLNFIGFIYSGDHSLYRELIAMSFSRGEFSTGQNLISAIAMRKIPLWSQVWAINSKFKEKGVDRKWWGFAYGSPQSINEEFGPFIGSEEVEFFKSSYEELKELHNKQLLGVDLATESPPEAGSGDGNIADGSEY